MDAGEEQQQRRQEACRLWALFAVLAGVVGRQIEPAAAVAGVLVVVVAVKCHQLTGSFAMFGY